MVCVTPAGKVVTIGGFTSAGIRVVDITKPEAVQAVVGEIEPQESGFAITSVNLEVRAKIPGADQAKFDELTKKAKEGCPVSKLLKANITMDAKLT